MGFVGPQCQLVREVHAQPWSVGKREMDMNIHVTLGETICRQTLG